MLLTVWPTTSNVAMGTPDVVSMPTLIVPSPSTIELLATTKALAPIAVALESLVCVPGPEKAPMNVLLVPVVLALFVVWPAFTPSAVLKLPVVLEKRALNPLAVLSEPVVLWKRLPSPLEVFSLPVVLKTRSDTPLAALRDPVVSGKRAFSPLTVLLLPVRLSTRVFTPVAVLESPLKPKFPAPWPTNVFDVPKL